MLCGKKIDNIFILGRYHKRRLFSFNLGCGACNSLYGTNAHMKRSLKRTFCTCYVCVPTFWSINQILKHSKRSQALSTPPHCLHMYTNSSGKLHFYQQFSQNKVPFPYLNIVLFRWIFVRYILCIFKAKASLVNCIHTSVCKLSS